MADWLQNLGADIFKGLGLIKETPKPTTDIWGNKPLTPKTPIAAPNYQIASSPSNSLELQLLQQQIEAIRAQSAATPRLPFLDTASARATATSKAGSSVNPVYQDKLNNQLERYTLQRTQQTGQVDAAKAASDTDLRYTQEDIGTNRLRTDQDVNTAIDQSLYNEDQFQQTEGSEFDVNNRAARTALAEAGLTESGLGQQELEQTTLDRNRASNNQLKDFSDERATQNLFRTRTFEDLDVKGNRAIELNDTTKQDLDRQLNDFISMQAQDERDFRLNNESDRQAALYDATNDIYSTDVQTWLAGLKDQGWRPQDIALAAQVYA